jgi:2-polyprenyl-3-methyl-5-hydroxy-6-metoxy-1,4-benzoquinol methylase
MRPLLDEKELIWSAVVANSVMNRDRNASGINSYEKEFKLIPADYLEKLVKENGQASWLDLCCGSGLALIQTASVFARKGLQQQVTLKGIDLLDTFPPVDTQISCLDLEVNSVVDWQSDSTYDLITCSHGLHYLGDKLKVITAAITSLKPNGYFIAHLDLTNIQVKSTNSDVFLRKLFIRNNLHYNIRNKLITRKGAGTFVAELRYLGADDQAGPNYTGQGAVTSYYDLSTGVTHQ